MTWSTTTDADLFLDVAGPLLAADPVAGTMLLTEARFWTWWAAAGDEGRFGWWTEDGQVRAATVALPDHPLLCSPLPASAARELVALVDGASSVGVDGADVDLVTEVLTVHGRSVTPRATLRLLRLDGPPPLVTGASRRASADDLPLLRLWFDLFRQRVPSDPSQVEFVVDHPVAAGAMTLWEVDGEPVAMASRTPEVAGMTRLGLAFQPTDGTTYADAAFAAACADARRVAEHVLVLSAEPTTWLQKFGFVPVLDRVRLDVR